MVRSEDGSDVGTVSTAMSDCGFLGIGHVSSRDKARDNLVMLDDAVEILAATAESRPCVDFRLWCAADGAELMNGFNHNTFLFFLSDRIAEHCYVP